MRNPELYIKKNFSDFCNSARKLNSFYPILLANTYLCNSQNEICQLVLKQTEIVYFCTFKKSFENWDTYVVKDLLSPMNWHPQTKRCKKNHSCLSCQTKKAFGIVAVWPQSRYSREFLKVLCNCQPTLTCLINEHPLINEQVNTEDRIF